MNVLYIASLKVGIVLYITCFGRASMLRQLRGAMLDAHLRFNFVT